MARRPGKRDANAKAPAQPPAPRPMTEAERSELLALGERAQRQPRAPRFKAAGEGKVTHADGLDPSLFVARIAAAVGTTDEHAMNHLTTQAVETVPGDDVVNSCNTALAVLAGIAPRNETEGMLAVQMVGCHNLAMGMLRRATKTDRVDFLTIYGSLAAKLLRTFTLQTEALARLRGQTGQQTVRVEHVTVEAGGQAVVGAVTTGGGGCDPKPTNNPMHRDGAAG